jgi:hypothetical protein
MDIEFHYYITYLVARRAGFPPDDAYAIGYASQYTDDNNDDYDISEDTAEAYTNEISQTLNILKPRKDLVGIYPVFHFMPGTAAEMTSGPAQRDDGLTNTLNTIPDNTNAQTLLRAALDTNDLYRIGIATHMFVDTFAHQNFTGSWSEFNFVQAGIVEAAIPPIGHAHALHKPDIPGLLWQDMRLAGSYADVNNKERFLGATRRLYQEYRTHLPAGGDEEEALAADISNAIGASGDNAAKGKEARIGRYVALMGNEFREYRKDAWFTEAVDFLLVDTGEGGPDTTPQQKAVYKGKADYKNSPWDKFQEAVKQHKAAAQALLGPLLETG